ncbi:MAG TPA: hypothetical protein V6C90_13715 [Coleofasciculaceae cyanobacterium]
MKIYIYSSPFRTMPLGREAVKIYVKELQNIVGHTPFDIRHVE